MCTQPCIVVAERDAARRRSLVVALCREGYDVREAENGRQLLAYIEYLAATRGKRCGPSHITADSFAVVAGADLQDLTADEVQEILRRARWGVSMLRLPMKEEGKIGALRAFLRETLPLDRPR